MPLAKSSQPAKRVDDCSGSGRMPLFRAWHRRRRVRFAIGLAFGLAILFFGALWGASRAFNTNPPTNRAQTSATSAPELRSRFYTASLQDVEAVARRVARQQTTWGRAWKVVYLARADNDPARRTLDVEVPVLFFTDDLVVQLEELDAGRTRVDVESRSRVGRGDFGENRRHIVQFLRALDAAMSG